MYFPRLVNLTNSHVAQHYELLLTRLFYGEYFSDDNLSELNEYSASHPGIFIILMFREKIIIKLLFKFNILKQITRYCIELGHEV